MRLNRQHIDIIAIYEKIFIKKSLNYLNLPTFFTSNLTIEELENHLQITNTSADKIKARRIVERIKFLSDEVSLVGVNRRSE